MTMEQFRPVSFLTTQSGVVLYKSYKEYDRNEIVPIADI